MNFILLAFLALCLVGCLVAIPAIVLAEIGRRHMRSTDPDYRGERGATWLGWLKLTRPLRRRFMQWESRRRRRGQPAQPDHIVGYKWAFVGLERAEGAKIVFRPLREYSYDWYSYGVSAKAVCQGWGAHWHPAAYCESSPGTLLVGKYAYHRCGFHALSRPEYLGKVPGGYADLRPERLASLALLQVDLHGTIVPGEFGWRAERQEVLRVAFGRRCAFCIQQGRRRDRRAVGLAWLAYSLAGWTRQVIAPACGAHSDPSLTLLSVANNLRTEVVWQE